MDTRVSPFDQIKECEAAEETRLNKALDALSKEEMAAAQQMQEAEKLAEEKIREEAMAELVAFRTQMGEQTRSAETDVQKELKALEKHFSERSAKEAAVLADQFLDIAA